MSVPKTPLPWRVVEKVYVETETGRAVGRINNADNAAYAVHAANVLPEVVGALREMLEATDDHPAGFDLARSRQAARAALAKAEVPS